MFMSRIVSQTTMIVVILEANVFIWMTEYRAISAGY